MKRLISLILAAVMMCMALSACGEEAIEPAPLSVTTKVITREYYEAHKDWSDFGIDHIILSATISTAAKMPIDVIFPVKIGLALTSGRYPYYEDAAFYNANLRLVDLFGKRNEMFDVYTSELKEFEIGQQPLSLIAYYGDIGIDDKYRISLDEYFEQKTYDFTTLYLQVDCREEKSGNLRFTLNYCSYHQEIDLYYAMDGEYIAYSVESVEAAQEALNK